MNEIEKSYYLVNGWISTSDKLPEIEMYYKVIFENGEEDEKPFRIRPSKNIYGFMSERKVIFWKELGDE